MKRVLAGLAIAATMASSALAAPKAFNGPYNIRVYQVTNNVFEVVIVAGNGYGFWCGASDYARRALGAGWQDQVTIVSEMARSVVTGGRSAVQFTLNPEAEGITPKKMGYSINGLNKGETISIQKGSSYCDQRLLNPALSR
ncbi:MAG: hypothetical protein ACU0BB_06605 [Paracoccaceae bacterium]